VVGPAADGARSGVGWSAAVGGCARTCLTSRSSLYAPTRPATRSKAGEWDERHEFPEAALRAAAALGFGGLYVRPESGGTGLSRADALPIVEALAAADVR
jgi:alkylation response protein AidB-like acyl-CoA dehydrogenase